jgi:hypothetical protein
MNKRKLYSYEIIWNTNHPDNPVPEKGYVIHHKNLNHNDNVIDNLQKITTSQHASLHNRLNKPGNQNNTGKKIPALSLIQKEKSHPRKQNGQGFKKGYIQSKEHSKKISLALKGIIRPKKYCEFCHKLITISQLTTHKKSCIKIHSLTL